ncbi:MAG: hypothetical protein ABSA03_22525 [Streptosporangiaceae bacterium]|jgi:hypothetical protein
MHPRDGRLEGWCYLTEGYLIFLRVDGDSIAAKPGGEVYRLDHHPGCRVGGRADAARGHFRHRAALQLVIGARRGA